MTSLIKMETYEVNFLDIALGEFGTAGGLFDHRLCKAQKAPTRGSPSDGFNQVFQNTFNITMPECFIYTNRYVSMYFRCVVQLYEPLR